MTTERLAQYLSALRIKAGNPTIRELARATGCGKTTVGDALTGRVVATWPVTKALVNALGGDESEARTQWGSAKGAGSVREGELPEWLISVRVSVPEFRAGRGLVDACTLAQHDPGAAIRDGWEVIRLSALQLSGQHYGDVPGSWSSNVVETLRRARDDGRLPPGVAEQAKLLHHMYVVTMMPEPEARMSSTAAVQYVCLAYRLAWLVWDVAYPHDAPKEPESS